MASTLNASTSSGLVNTADTSGILQLQTAGTAAVTIDTSQNVGIGTSSPATKFQVAGASGSLNARINAGNTGLDITNNDSTGVVNLATTPLGGGGKVMSFTMYNGSSSAEAMRIDSSGSVGIGTSSPANKLQITNSGNTQIRVSDSTLAYYFDFGRDTSDGFFQINGNQGYGYKWLTNGSERMRIDSSGNVLIGTTNTTPTNTSVQLSSGILYAGGYRTHNGTSGSTWQNAFNIYWNGSAAELWIDSTKQGTIAYTSDYRIKRNIETQNVSGLDRITKLRPVTYQMADYGTLFKATDEVKEGFIAHEVQEVIPSGVDGEKDAENQIQSLRLDAILSVAVKAIQEQQTLITSLTARVTALEGATSQAPVANTGGTV
jgi:hypothetical protein